MSRSDPPVYVDVPVYEGNYLTNAAAKLKNEILKHKINPMTIDSSNCFNEKVSYFYLNSIHYLQVVWDEVELDSAGKASIKRQEQHNSFNEITGELIEELTPDKNTNVFTQGNISPIIDFSLSVFKRDAWAYNTFMATNFSSVKIKNTSNLAENIYMLFVKKQSLLEKLLKTGRAAFVSALENGIENEVAESVSELYDIPNKAITILAKSSNSMFLKNISEFTCSDRNEYVIFAEFIKNLMLLETGIPRKNRIDSVTKILETLAEINKADVPVKPLLEYVIKQTWQYADFTLEEFLKKCKYFRDYTNLRVQIGGEKFPQNVLKAHNIIMKEQVVLSDRVKEAFVVATNGYRHLEDTVSVLEKDGKHEFVVIVPNNVFDLINEGNALNHCVGSWCSLIAAGSHRVLFLREKNNPSASLVTFEINPSNEIIHSAGINNCEPNDIQMKALNEWEKNAKKK